MPVVPRAPATDPARRTHPAVYLITGLLIAVVLVAVVASVSTTRYASQTTSAPAPGDRALRAEREAAGAAQAERAARAELPAAKAAAAGEQAVPKAEPADRKIIYTARLDLVVKNLDDAEKQIDDLLTASGGRLVRSESRGDAGSKRTASFTLEVPSGKFRPFVTSLRKLGVPERDSVDSQDVTEEYVDIQARVKHLKAEEDNLLKLLGERARSVEEQLAIRRQIQPIREAIERAEGRQKFIEAKAAVSTVTLNVREEANYVPPTVEPPPAPPTFTERVASTFAGSWGLLVRVGEAVALFGVAITPWLPVAVPLGLVLVWAARRLGVVTPRPVAVPVTDRPPPAG